jgi:hypothetical protein
VAAVAELVDGGGFAAPDALVEHALKTGRAAGRLRLDCEVSVRKERFRPCRRLRFGLLLERGGDGSALLRGGFRRDLELHRAEG